jgi:hypothetical protein
MVMVVEMMMVVMVVVMVMVTVMMVVVMGMKGSQKLSFWINELVSNVDSIPQGMCLLDGVEFCIYLQMGRKLGLIIYYFNCCAGGTLWHFQKFLQYVD